ncbi:WxL domain-containing protein [Erysipelothrix sp. HDW6C]|uniref:WxL domain-containing protein n=1 Tax=Erysipelothrix sp. HDW6C TaxID=2714930 RepID=UPI001408FA7E|nr:WxL domain-containing protein [Erysipelothrix sp. HDW6C]QIK69831.1 WxL domain-containing protein [Erysipelothrix sp. HDW6C]
MKKITRLFAALAVLLTVSTVVSADENGGSETSTASVSFIANEGPTKPVNPIDPTDPVLPETDEENKETEMAGPLSLDVVPNLGFGQQKITGSIETYETTNLVPYIQVTDTRGTMTGWTVSAQLTNFTSGDETIDNARLTFGNSVIKTSNTNDTNRPTSATSVTLVSGSEAKTMMNASAGNGMGTWLNTWLANAQTDATNSNVTLDVETSQAKALAYEATINWTLSVAP